MNAAGSAAWCTSDRPSTSPLCPPSRFPRNSASRWPRGGIRSHSATGRTRSPTPPRSTSTRARCRPRRLPASNGIGTAHGLARMYAALIGEVDGTLLLTPETLESATKEQASGKDQVMLIPSRFSTGYILPTETNPMIGPGSFGHTGRGGSLGFADLEHGVAFGYAMNNIVGGADDVRAALLVDSVRRSLV
ncbi:serine hydrolase domain-containing protein [Streptomyces sp. NPDC059928]|uniref:serine hydrolase domain-containing protein n=1 Tax=unclassified Streptomyces TaxID=2593676 RepID=UPI003650BB3B